MRIGMLCVEREVDENVRGLGIRCCAPFTNRANLRQLKPLRKFNAVFIVRIATEPHLCDSLSLLPIM